MQVPDWLSLAADVASLVGLIGTGVVWVQTRDIRKSILTYTRVPESRATLNRMAEQLLPFLTGWPKLENEASVLLARVEAALTNLLPKLPTIQRKSVSKLLARLPRTQDSWKFWVPDKPRTADDMWEIYSGLMGTVEMLDQLSKDIQRRT
jgi:hypothetical protein